MFDKHGNRTKIQVQGYVTDPKQVGFQVLTNYESTYWRALVGSDAWSLYEVLRSFCHDRDNVCYPSINSLMAILGLKQRRVLTGWTTKVKGKRYRYPGLIEILQSYMLIVVETKGETHEIRYLFHVNLTPGSLTDEQLETLPPYLRTKHKALIERCERQAAALEAKRRPAKFGTVTQTAADETDGSTSDNLSQGSDKLSKASDNLSDKQQQENSTHETTTDTVVALRSAGLSAVVAERISQRYSKERINEKVSYLRFLRKVG